MKLATDFKIKLRRLLIGFFGLLIFSLIFDPIQFSDFQFSWIFRYGLGGFLFVAGMLLAAISGRQLRLYGRSDDKHLPRGTTDQFVTRGLYAHLRHPAFQGFCLLTFGIGLLVNSPTFVFVAAPLADAYILYFALTREEQEAFQKFGSEYEKYLQRVPAFWPPFLFKWTLKKICYAPIGIIHTPFKTMDAVPKSPVNGKTFEAEVEIFPEYSDGLLDVEGFSHLILIFHLHLRRNFKLKIIPRRARQVHGVFATRSPNRPNPIGLSVVRLLKVEGNRLIIKNIDIIDGTPLLDIKPYIPEIDAAEEVKLGWLETENGQGGSG